MANEANFRVRLFNGVSRAGKSAAQSLRTLRAGFTKTGRATLLTNLRLQAGSEKLDKLSLRVLKTALAYRRLKGRVLATLRPLKAVGRAAVWTAGKLALMGKAFSGSKIQKGLSSLADKLGRVAKTTAIIGGVAGIAIGGILTKSVAEASIFAEKTQLAFELLTGSAAGGVQVFKKSISLARELGLDIGFVTSSFRSLLAQQFSIKESVGLIKMVSDLRAIGIEGEKTKRVLMAITQIRAKGRLQMEEMLQLAEAGVSLQLVGQALEKLTGKSREQIRKLQEAGKIGPDIALEAIGLAVKKKVGVEKVGDAGKRFANEMLQGAADRLKAAPRLKFLEIAKVGNIKPILRDIINDVSSALDSTRLAVSA